MSSYNFDNFGDLYRAAFAEPDPEIKQLLLADVKRALDRWAELETTDVMVPMKVRSSAAITATPKQQAA